MAENKINKFLVMTQSIREIKYMSYEDPTHIITKANHEIYERTHGNNIIMMKEFVYNLISEV